MPICDIFGHMNALATSLGAVNLGHGFAEDPPLKVLVKTATRAMRGGQNQYSPSEGLEILRNAIAQRNKLRGLSYDADTEITITTGCTEALVAALRVVAPPGSEVIAFEPFYDLYPDMVTLVGAHLVTVPLHNVGHATKAGCGLLQDLQKAITPATRALLLNSPHNPTGVTLSGEMLHGVANLAIRHDLVVLADSVYDEFVYDGTYVSIASVEGMRERTIICSSATKTLSVSGWRVGWACAPSQLTVALRNTHRSLTFCAPSPLQAGVAAALEWADQSDYFAKMRRRYARRRDMLVEGLQSAGLEVPSPPAGHFVVANVRSWSDGASALEFAIRLAREAGVVAIPLTTSVATPGFGNDLLRFTFCKPEKTILEASQRLHRYATERF